MGTGHRDLLVVCGHWTDLFSWTTETEICLEFVDTGHRDFLFGFTGFWTTKTEPNRNQSVWTGFGFKILKLIMSVWFIFLCKNRTELDLLTPIFYTKKLTRGVARAMFLVISKKKMSSWSFNVRISRDQITPT